MYKLCLCSNAFLGCGRIVGSEELNQVSDEVLQNLYEDHYGAIFDIP